MIPASPGRLTWQQPGRLPAIGCLTMSTISDMADIRLGGPSLVRDLLAGVQDGTWVIVNTTEYPDLETVACGVLLAERADRSFLFRTGPSSVRALAGLASMAPLRGRDAAGQPGHCPHLCCPIPDRLARARRQVVAILNGEQQDP